MGSDLADFIMASGAWRRISKAGHMTDTDPADFHPKILAIREPSTHASYATIKNSPQIVAERQSEPDEASTATSP